MKNNNFFDNSFNIQDIYEENNSLLGFENNSNFPDNNFNIQDIYKENSSLLDFENNENSNWKQYNKNNTIFYNNT